MREIDNAVKYLQMSLIYLKDYKFINIRSQLLASIDNLLHIDKIEKKKIADKEKEKKDKDEKEKKRIKEEQRLFAIKQLEQTKELEKKTK